MRLNIHTTGRIILGGILALLLVQAALLMAGIPGQPCHVDEAWMGEQAYTEARDGVASQKLLTGMFGFDRQMLIRHKLFITLGSILTRAGGFHLPLLRLISLFSGLALVIMMFRYLGRREPERMLPFLLTITVFLMCPLVFRYVNTYRPEFLLSALGFASFLFVLRTTEDNHAVSAAAAGIMAGMAVLAHLNGVIFIAAGFGTLLLYRRWKTSAIFLSISLTVASAYFYDVIGHVALFREQFFNDFVVEKTDYGILAPLKKIFGEHRRYFRTPEIVGISVLFLLTLPAVFSRKLERHGVFYRYLLILFLALGAAAKSITTKYALPLIPFFALGTGITLGYVIRRESARNRLYAGIILVLFAAHAGYGLFSAGTSAYRNRTPVARENSRYAQSMLPGSRVLAPGRFIFNEIGRFEIRDIHAARYIIMHKTGRPFNLSTLTEYAADNGFDYILIDREYRGFGNIDPAKVFPPIWGYEVIKEYRNQSLLLKRYDRN